MKEFSNEKLISLMKELRDKEINPWKTVGIDVQYKIFYDDINKTLEIYFQCSSSRKDWNLNLDFFVTPYKKLKNIWFVHRGFVKGYKSAQDYIWKDIDYYLTNYEVNDIIISGYSLGGAYATLLHEDFGFKYPKLVDNIFTITFGSPKVAWLGWWISKRWKNMLRIVHRGDLVTHVPFSFLLFFHKGIKRKIGSFKLLLLPEYHKAKYYLDENNYR